MALNGPHSALATNTGTKLRLSFKKQQGLSFKDLVSLQLDVYYDNLAILIKDIQDIPSTYKLIIVLVFYLF